MATCKDCVHYEVCFDYTHLKYSENLPDNREDVCEHFKNKANFVEVEQGEWIKFTLGSFDFAERYKCSVCNNIVLPANNHIDNFLYCSHCGAKMKGGVE